MANYGRIHNIYSIYIDDIDTQDDDDTTMFSISDRLEAIQFNPEHNYWLCVENYAADLLKSANLTQIDDNSNGIFNICSTSIHQEGSYENINSISETYFNGSIVPLKYAAKFNFYNEIIEVRHNWDLEGITLIIN